MGGIKCVEALLDYLVLLGLKQIVAVRHNLFASAVKRLHQVPMGADIQKRNPKCSCHLSQTLA